MIHSILVSLQDSTEFWSKMTILCKHASSKILIFLNEKSLFQISIKNNTKNINPEVLLRKNHKILILNGHLMIKNRRFHFKMIIFWFRNFKIFIFTITKTIFVSILIKKNEFWTEITDFECKAKILVPNASIFGEIQNFWMVNFQLWKISIKNDSKKYSSGNPRSKLLTKFINKCKITKIGVVRKKSYNLLQIDYLTDYACRRFYHVDLVSITAGDFQDYTAWYQGQTNMYTVHIILPLVHHTCL